MSRREFRRSQGIVPFGVGAIIDFPEESLMMAGLDAWPVQMVRSSQSLLREATRVQDARLRQRLTKYLERPIREFFMPPEAPEVSGQSKFGANPLAGEKAPTPFVRFPEWHFCPRCRSMQVVRWNASGPAELRCSNDRFRRAASSRTQPCSALPERRRPKLVPVRFIVACGKGHISDFPWVRWAHRGGKGCGAEPGTLFLVSTGGAGLEGLKVECRCGKNRTMRGAFSPGTLADETGCRCPGHRPWLGPAAAEDCGEELQTVQRGASNVYFAEVMSSILIPPHSEKLHQTLDRPRVWNQILDVIGSFTVDGKPPPVRSAAFKTMALSHDIDPETFVQGVRDKIADPARWEGAVEESEEAYRAAERRAFLGPRPVGKERDHFDVRAASMEAYSHAVRRLFSHIVLLPRLRETRVLIGFTRLVPFDGDLARLAPLSRNKLDWLPGVGINGEGIYFELDQDALRDWAAHSPALAARVKILNRRRQDVAKERDVSLPPIPQMLPVVHTLSHLLIRRLSFDCGYDTSSLRERLYVSDDPEHVMAGVLIYTVSGDSEGSLGGLVRQGGPGYFDRTLVAALQDAEFCSSDPLCRDSEGQGYYGMNLAACHACALLPETSCEHGNRLLDRVPLVGDAEAGYFSDVLE